MKRYLVLTALSIGIFGATASAANAGVLVTTSHSCEGQELSQPFKPYLDFNYYTPAPGGSFEGSDPDWQLNGASVENGALTVPSGASATSSTICVGLGHPTMRFYAKSSKLLTLSTLTVEVLYEDPSGDIHSLPIGAVLPGTTMKPTLPFLVLANLFPLFPNQYTPVAFRFKANGPATWTVDDVYVDPRKH